MKLELIYRTTTGPTVRIVVKKLPVVIGRGYDAQVHLDDGWVSRRHCQIHEIDGELVVRDLNSENGTFVNGLEVTETQVAPGDELLVGTTALVMEFTRPNARPPLQVGKNRRGVGEHESGHPATHETHILPRGVPIVTTKEVGHVGTVTKSGHGDSNRTQHQGQGAVAQEGASEVGSRSTGRRPHMARGTLP